MSNETASTDSVSTILSNAASAGIISSKSQSMIETHLDDIAIAGCEGVDIDDIDSEEVTLVAVVIDASGSMHDFASDVIQNYKEQFLDPLRKAKNADSILVSVWVFSGYGGTSLVHGYTPVPQCNDLTPADYSPNGSTPLFDAIFDSLTGLVTYGQNLRDNGTRTKSIVVVLSDGQENDSRKASGSAVRTLTKDVLRAQEFVLSYVYFGDGASAAADGDEAAKDIGFPLHHRLTSDLDGSAIRKVFGQVSASVISTSQTVVSSGSISGNAFFGLDLNP